MAATQNLLEIVAQVDWRIVALFLRVSTMLPSQLSHQILDMANPPLDISICRI